MVHFKIDSVEPVEYSKPVDPEVEAFVVMYNSGDITFYLRRADLACGNVRVTVVDSGSEYIERDSDSINTVLGLLEPMVVMLEQWMGRFRDQFELTE